MEGRKGYQRQSQGPLETTCNPSGRRLQPTHKPIIVFDLNGVLCHMKQIPKVPHTSYCTPQEIDYDGELDTLINQNSIQACPSL